MSEFFKVEGLRELDQQLAQLDTKIGFKVLRSAMMAATRPMFAAAKASAQSTGVKGFDAGATAAAMGRWTRKIDQNTTTLFLGPKNKNKKALALWNAKHGVNISRLQHFHLLEFGSINGPAQPFLRPAFQRTAPTVARELGKQLRIAIDKAVGVGR